MNGTAGEKELDALLSLLEAHVDCRHVSTVDEDYARALAYQPVAVPPLVVMPRFPGSFDLPAPWDAFTRYEYRESFENPVAMLQNALLNRVVPGVLLRDWSPLAIRGDHGTIQVASVLGGAWRMYENNYPCVSRFDSVADIERMLDEPLPAGIAQRGVMPISIATLRFYNAKLRALPSCAKAIQVSMPDLQGPIDTAEMVWGSDIYYAFYDNPGLLGRLLARVTETLLAMEKIFRPLTLDRLDPKANAQHGYMIPGRLLIRNDSSILITPDMYAEQVQPHDERILEELGGGSIHFCGNGEHLVGKMLGIEHLEGLDFGDSRSMDIGRIYAMCRERGVAISNVNPSREDLVSGKAARDFPTGAVFVYETDSFADAADLVRSYRPA
jgi:hypothetical protein